uniref:Uncharacterized protein n=1 Tax=viral metagenome TaxID=1070528 RepID=A0A6C0AY23_9ZZZZ
MLFILLFIIMYNNKKKICLNIYLYLINNGILL